MSISRAQPTDRINQLIYDHTHCEKDPQDLNSSKDSIHRRCLTNAGWMGGWVEEEEVREGSERKGMEAGEKR